MNKKSIKTLSRVPKNEISNAKKLQIITWLGTKNCHDKEKQEFGNTIEKNDHPNVQKKK